MLDSITIDELKQKNCWVNYCEETADKGRKTKVPYSPLSNGRASVTASETWSTFNVAEAMRQYQNRTGNGVVITDNLCGIDIDGLNHDTDYASENPLSEALLQDFDDTYCERSPSGTGYHILGLCDASKLPIVKDEDGNPVIKDNKYQLSPEYLKKNSDLGIEIYPANITSRYLTFTGDVVNDMPLVDITDKVNAAYETYMAKEPRKAKKAKKIAENRAIIKSAKEASNGFLFTELYDNGDTSRYGGDDSCADLALCSLLAYWCKGDRKKIDTIFRSSALYREKWERDDYRERTIDKACGNSFIPTSESRRIIVDSTGKSVKPHLSEKILEGWLIENGITIRKNIITHNTEIFGVGGGYDKETIEQKLHVIVYDQIRDIWACRKEEVRDYLQIIAGRTLYNPVDAIVNSNPQWDGRDRLGELYEIMRLPAEDHYSRVYIHKWLLQAMALAHNEEYAPFGADGILVLTGEQGIGKTSLVNKLGCGNNDLCKLGLSINNRDKDTLIRATSCWIGELGEVGSTMKSDVDALKNFITEHTDKIRAPYAMTDANRVRRTSYIATGNNNEYLVDETGSRRFWTVPCAEKFDLEALSKFDASQLWKQIANELSQHEYSTEYCSDYQTCFRLNSSEREALAKRNASHQKKIKGETEVADILYDAKIHPEKYSFEEVTPTMFKMAYPELNDYTATDIGRVFAKLQIPAIVKRLDGNHYPSKGCRKLPIPIKSNTDLQAEYSKDIF